MEHIEQIFLESTESFEKLSTPTSALQTILNWIVKPSLGTKMKKLSNCNNHSLLPPVTTQLKKLDHEDTYGRAQDQSKSTNSNLLRWFMNTFKSWFWKWCEVYHDVCCSMLLLLPHPSLHPHHHYTETESSNEIKTQILAKYLVRIPVEILNTSMRQM